MIPEFRILNFNIRSYTLLGPAHAQWCFLFTGIAAAVLYFHRHKLRGTVSA